MFQIEKKLFLSIKTKLFKGLTHAFDQKQVYTGVYTVYMSVYKMYNRCMR